MKRQRAFMDQSAGITTKRAKTVSIVPVQPKLNKTQTIQVQRMLKNREEQKSFVAGSIAATIPLVAAINSLADIPIGNTDNARVGNHVHLRQLHGKLAFIAGDATQVMRAIIFKWKENDSFNPPTAAQILANGPSGGPDVYSTYNRDSPGNYQILKDFFIVGSSGTSSSKLIQSREFTIKLSGKVQFWSDVGVAGTNKIYIMIQSDSAAVPNPTLSSNFELLYSDA